MSAPRDPGPLSPAERELVLAVRGLAYGSVEAVVHDGRLVQIERREKVRLPDPDSSRIQPTRPREASPSHRGATGRPEPPTKTPGDHP